MPERFVSEAIKPVVATSDTLRMAAGEPGLPREFVWRDQTITIVAVLRSWRETGRCSHGSPELYVRKHWYEVVTASNGTMKIYFVRQPRGGRQVGRWWLFSICEEEKDQ
jgi:phosphoribosylglycinamide formyltransferase-1